MGNDADRGNLHGHDFLFLRWLGNDASLLGIGIDATGEGFGDVSNVADVDSVPDVVRLSLVRVGEEHQHDEGDNEDQCEKETDDGNEIALTHYASIDDRESTGVVLWLKDQRFIQRCYLHIALICK